MGKKTVALIIALCALLVLAVWVWHQARIDSCLDRGGRWDYEHSTCEGAIE